MKRDVLLLFALLLTTVTMSAQFRITPEVGVSMFKTEYRKATSSPRIGVGVDYSFSNIKGWGLSSGLYFYQKKETGSSGSMWLKNNDFLVFDLDRPMYDKVEIADIEKFSIGESSIRRCYMQLPLLATYTWKFAQNSSLSLGVGPYVAWNIAGKHKISLQEYDMKKEEFSFTEYEASLNNRFEVGLSTMLSLEVNHWLVKMNYETNLNRRDRNKDHLISLGVGYKFSL